MACLAQGYKLADAEANTLLPCLVEKSGHSQVRPPSKPYRNFQSSTALISLASWSGNCVPDNRRLKTEVAVQSLVSQ